jgi:hypothetical protein
MPPPTEKEEPAHYAFISEEEALSQIEKFRASGQGQVEIPTVGRGPIEGQRNPYGLEDISLAPRCPHCAKEMPSADAVICLHCGYNTQTRTHIKTKRTFANTAQDRLHWRLPGIVGVFLVVLFSAWIGFVWFAFSPLAEQNPTEWWVWFDGLPFKVWTSIPAAFIVFFSGVLAYKRLIAQREPPETEKD